MVASSMRGGRSLGGRHRALVEAFKARGEAIDFWLVGALVGGALQATPSERPRGSLTGTLVVQFRGVFFFPPGHVAYRTT